MAVAPPQETVSQPKAISQIQRLAWIIMLVSFSLFCSFSVALTGGVFFFLFRSTLPMDAHVQLGRGTAGLITVDSQLILRNGGESVPVAIRPASLSTGTVDQLTLSFSILHETSTVFPASITLRNDSSFTLQSARSPRFSWSQGNSTIELSDFSGEADIFVTDIPDHPLSLRIKTLRGASTFVFDSIGRYSIVANETVIRVTTREGRALLVSPDNRNNRFAVAGEQVTLLTGTSLPIVSTAPVDLIDNGLFAFDISTNENGDLQVPQQWGCFANFDAPPGGEWFADTINGRSAIHLRREVGDKSSKTGCSRWLDVSVENYSLLELQATFSLNEQSLVNCGFVGSECPMMIFIDYNDANGQEHSWHQSFFYNYDPQNPAPLVCQECAFIYEEHRPISSHVWYTYDSGNLFARIPEEQRPSQILEVRFYASGHRYDVLVSEMSLIAGVEQVIPREPDGN